jgi:hypothetical protein
MLRNVLGVYLDNIKERDFDLPFATLLPALGFYDVHFTHGTTEFGKDFIAKRDENDKTIQYSFQTKVGDITQHDWRTNIMGQMLETVHSSLSHPNFNNELPHQAVLVTTGKLKSNVAIGLQDFNNTSIKKYAKLPIIVWDRELLISMIETNGLSGVHQANASGFIKYGKFYQLYGKSMEHGISNCEIEELSSRWINNSIKPEKRILGSVVEAHIFSDHCLGKGLIYESIYAHMSAIRTILNEINNCDVSNLAHLLHIYNHAIDKLIILCNKYIENIIRVWDDSNNNLASISSGPCSMITYLIHCSRIIEVSGCSFFLEKEQTAKDRIALFIKNFISIEPGCSHIPSDRYAVSLVLPLLALNSAGFQDVALEFVRKSTVWLCDRHQEGFGLADVSADAYKEITILLGYAFDFIKSNHSKTSFLATVLSDLAAFLGEKSLYSDVINDIYASTIYPQYWQIPDSESLFCLDGKDIITYPNIEYSEKIDSFTNYDFAEHVKHELRSFNITKHVGPMGLMIMMVFLRDRYFPTLWPQLI